MRDVERAIAILEEVSPPLAAALRTNPGLVDGVAPGASVGARVHAALIGVALDELSGTVGLAAATRRLSDAIDEIVADQLGIAVEQAGSRHPIAAEVPFAVIAMGKWGGRELNYYSDIDLVFVHDRAGGDETATRAAALAIASHLVANLSAPTFDGPGLNVDAGLRPEGSMGPLSRSIDGYAGYYGRWGEAWELQALLKARPAAGHRELGDRFRELADRVVWENGLDVFALRSIRTLKVRAEEQAGPDDIKRSRGGIRDIEFAVQLLQLVHGRVDPELRAPATLDAISALHRHGYVEDDEAEGMTDAYLFLRTLEHRLQLKELRQTHTLPRDAEGREWLGRALGFSVDPARQLEHRLAEVRAMARDLHERLYFRPILDSLVGLESARLDPAEAAVRLEALGFRNVVAAQRALTELTSGLSRRSRVMHQALPLMLDWLGRTPDPDLGLEQLRLLLSRTSDHSTLVTILQVNPLAGERLCRLLGSSRLVGDLMDRVPEFIPRLASDETIAAIRDRVAEAARLDHLLASRPDPDEKMGTIRRFVRRRKLRIAARDILVSAPVEDTLLALSDTADVAVGGALGLITSPDDRFGVIAMGKWGGRELSYGSDLDLMYVHDGDAETGIELAAGLRRLLSDASRHGEAYDIDAGLRPEGRKGPLSRSLDSFRRYYMEWVEPWELMALVKARPGAGHPELLAAYFETIEPVVWRPERTPDMVLGIRTIKARMESERIPAGENPDFHLKLGPGGLSDVEFATQFLQLRHGGKMPELRLTNTLEALEALAESGVLAREQHDALRQAYLFLTRIRLRLHLQRGRASDSLPTDPDATARLAASLGFDRAAELRELYRAHTRRARRAFEKVFYD